MQAANRFSLVISRVGTNVAASFVRLFPMPALQILPVSISSMNSIQMHRGAQTTRQMHINPYTGMVDAELERELQRKGKDNNRLMQDFTSTMMDKARSHLQEASMERRRRMANTGATNRKSSPQRIEKRDKVNVYDIFHGKRIDIDRHFFSEIKSSLYYSIFSSDVLLYNGAAAFAF